MKGTVAAATRPVAGQKVGKWIFVTGMPRGGTTFLGRVLSLPLAVDYIHEPFNPDCGLHGADIRFPYVTEGGSLEARYRPMIESLMRYDGDLKTALYKRDTGARRIVKRVIGSRGPFYLRLARMNVFRRAAVVKDPIGCLMTGFLARQYGFLPVVMVRHPVAVVASYQRLGWDARPHLLALREQPDFVRDHADLPGASAVTAMSQLEAAAVLWRVLNRALLRQAAADASIPVIRHEDVSVRPVEVVRALYDQLGLEWSERVRRSVERQTSADNDAEAPDSRVQHFRRASGELLSLRVSQLERDTRSMILDATRDVALPWYDEASFDA